MLGFMDMGGGMRDVYGAGVTDCFLDNGISFDYCIGVSAGCANIATFLAGQRGRNFRFYTDYALRKEYMSAENFIILTMCIRISAIHPVRIRSILTQ